MEIGNATNSTESIARKLSAAYTLHIHCQLLHIHCQISLEHWKRKVSEGTSMMGLTNGESIREGARNAGRERLEGCTCVSDTRAVSVSEDQSFRDCTAWIIVSRLVAGSWSSRKHPNGDKSDQRNEAAHMHSQRLHIYTVSRCCIFTARCCTNTVK